MSGMYIWMAVHTASFICMNIYRPVDIVRIVHVIVEAIVDTALIYTYAYAYPFIYFCTYAFLGTYVCVYLLNTILRTWDPSLQLASSLFGRFAALEAGALKWLAHERCA